MERPVFRFDSCPRTRAVAAAGLCLIAICLAQVAGADVLVLRDGSRIETQGKWETKGRQIVFKTAKGTLSALRASEVDLAASEKATAEAVAPKTEAKPAEAKKPVLVLTDKDVAKALPEGQEEAAAEGNKKPAAGSGRVEVVRSSLEYGGSEDVPFSVRGVVQNNSPVPVAEISVMAVVTVSRSDVNRRVYCEAGVSGPLAPKAEREFSCPIRQQDVLGTGMADAFADATLSFEVRSKPQAPPKKPTP